MTYKLLSLLDVSIVAFRHDHIFTYTIYISTFRSIYRQAMNFDYASTKPPSECDTNNSLHFHRTVSGSSARKKSPINEHNYHRATQGGIGFLLSRDDSFLE